MTTPTIDFATLSLNRTGEEVCGNIVEVTRDENGVTALFADGEGDGTGASVTASFFIRMARALLRNGATIRSVVSTVAETYTDSGCGQSLGFQALRIENTGEITLASMNMPLPILLNRRNALPCPYQEDEAGGKRIENGDFSLKSGTTMVLYNDGLLRAGLRRGTGWGRKEIELFLQGAYKPKNFAAERITQMLIFAAKSLEKGQPAQDISVLTLQLHSLSQDENR